MRSGNRFRAQLLLAISLVLISMVSVAGVASAKSFKNCQEVRKQFPNGVAVNKTSLGALPAQVSPKIYWANWKLDLDIDGIICENEILQFQLSPTTTTTSSTTTTSTTTTTTTIAKRIPPSGNWDGELLQDSKVLLYGAGYEHVLCTSGSPTQTLKLWVNINGTYVQRAESFPVVGDPWCPDPAYPVKHRFYWIVDWLGTASSSTRYNLDIKVTGLSSDFYIRRSVATSAGLNQEAADLARKIACLFGKITGC